MECSVGPIARAVAAPTCALAGLPVIPKAIPTAAARGPGGFMQRRSLSALLGVGFLAAVAMVGFRPPAGDVTPAPTEAGVVRTPALAKYGTADDDRHVCLVFPTP